MIDTYPAPDGSPTNLVIERFWFKIFNEVLSDIRFIRMSDALLGAYVRLLALANTSYNIGQIDGDADLVACALRMSGDEARGALAELEKLGFVFIGEGVIAIADERHFEGKGLNPSDSREAARLRKQKQRSALGQKRGILGHSDGSRAIEE